MAEQEMSKDAIDLLMEDHRTVEGLFSQFEAAEADQEKQQLAQRICLELKVHTMLEEEIFYPAVRGKVEDDLLDEAYVEHDAAKVLINEIEAGGAEEAFQSAKVKVLKEAIEHHVEEEEDERKGLFVQSRKADVDLHRLGEEMAARKAELMQEAEGAGLPPAETRTFLGVDQPTAEEGTDVATPPSAPGARPGVNPG
ncbi:hemerythrin domain-containing protein [Phenylobacterium sp.]|jgi:hemerythrin superfamily protein|uniref:hemerythrin domain-containing protein n=1 Tax=Phenylobacterium sp. TaxID=1871053 RepID=UPI002E37E676|nr:hemerythrin domain-containing protein [Phenylobacterium sp.]HEX2559698.1 hemerythrin domain-containing protein [Phenylobacterium sp.]